MCVSTDFCEPFEYLLYTYCYTVCPRRFYPASVTVDTLVTNGTTLHNVTVPKCLRCDWSCLQCTGPAVDQCTSCSAFHTLSSDHRCIDSPSALHHWRVPLIVSIVALCFVVLLTPFVVWLMIGRLRAEPKVSYQPVSDESDNWDDESTSHFLSPEEKS